MMNDLLPGVLAEVSRDRSSRVNNDSCGGDNEYDDGAVMIRGGGGGEHVDGQDFAAVDEMTIHTHDDSARPTNTNGGSGARGSEAGEALGCLPLAFGGVGVGAGGCVTRTAASSSRNLEDQEVHPQQTQHEVDEHELQQRQHEDAQLRPPRMRMQRFLDEVSAIAEETEWLRGELEAIEALHNRQDP